MNARSKIRLDSIEQAHRALDALPEHRPEELTKTQAIQRLIAPIRATQSKGYSLAAIGKVLSECGISLTTGALRAYVSEAKASGDGRKRKPKTRHAAKAHKATCGDAEIAPTRTPTPPKETAPKPTVAVPRSVDLDWEPAPERDKAVPTPAGAHRLGFEVCPDTEDL
jgi:hypothetical protein